MSASTEMVTSPRWRAESRWVRRVARPAPRMRLVCLPHAGAGASVFRPWPALLPVGIEVLALQLPGREERISDPVPPTVEQLAVACAIALWPFTDVPLGLYGHCAGALLAHQIAHVLRDRYDTEPAHLVVAAHAPPDREPPAEPLHTLPDDEFVAALRSSGGAPDALLRSGDLLKFLLPAIRADFALFETYRAAPRPPLACPITAVRGSCDGVVGAADCAGWAAQTTGAFRSVEVPGGHFFLTGLTTATAGALASVLLAAPTERDVKAAWTLP